MSASSPRLCLALQGGGAHGAFTWGVLDRLLDEAWFDVEGVSGTSSGAMNALALAQGWIDGGRSGAQTALRRFWEDVASQQSLLAWTLTTPFAPGAQALLRSMTAYLAPSQVNPLGINPLRKIAEREFDFAALRDGPLRLFVAATRVRDGALVLFDNARLDIEALLASACLPQVFPPVSIDGELYWDGGYAGNPALEPLVFDCHGSDVLCVLVQPLTRDAPPTSAREIAERIAELGFSTTFLRELESLRRGQRALEGTPQLSTFGRRVKNLHLHLIEPGEGLAGYRAKTRLDTRLGFLEELRDLGRARADAWLAAHRDDLGRRSTWTGLDV